MDEMKWLMEPEAEPEPETESELEPPDRERAQSVWTDTKVRQPQE